MSQNDIDSLNLIYKDWLETRPTDGLIRGQINPFEYFCAENFLKRFDLNDEEITYGMVGDNNDGGVDSFHFFLNGVLADDTTVVDRRSKNDIHLIIMQMKETKGFSPSQIRKLAVFTDDLLRIRLPADKHSTTYHPKLLRLMKIFKSKYQSMKDARIAIDYYFISTVDCEPDRDAENAARDVINKALEHFPRASVHPFHFINAQRLYDQVQVKCPSEKGLIFEKSLDAQEGWVGLVSLKNFYQFLQDEKGALNGHIFDDNVRGYYQNTPINEDITTSLKTSSRPEFWLLNNGITILTPFASSSSGKLTIHNPQIVNGLQTSRRIFDYYKAGVNLPQNDSRRILVRVIQNKDEAMRDEIIRATNNQNLMPAEALISTYRIHKQLDLLFQKDGFWYDYRKGHYKDEGKPISKIVSIIKLAQAVIAILVKKPQDARGRPRNYIGDERKRALVFGIDELRPPAQGELLDHRKTYDLKVYLVCVKIVQRVEDFLEFPNLKLQDNDKLNIRFYLARYVACALTKNAYCPPGELLKPEASLDTLTDKTIFEWFKDVWRLYEEHGQNDDAAKGNKMADALAVLLINKYSPPNKSLKARVKRAKANAAHS